MTLSSGFISGILSVAILATSCAENIINGEPWLMAPFTKEDAVNPILGAENSTKFLCPVRNVEVRWEAKDIFNPTALVRNGKVHLLYRAEDYEGAANGTSRIGLATSEDGFNFIREKTPIFYPDNDDFLDYEWEGGCEDPRIVEGPEEMYVMTYTGYNGSLAILMVATSKDLRSWTKYGPVFRNTNFLEIWSKSGSIVSELIDERLVALKINGLYWMYWGETDIFLATSTDLVDWAPLTDEDGELLSIFGPRDGKFDSDIVEPGPPAIMRDDGILLVYNSRNLGADGGDGDFPKGTYAAGQIVFSAENPTAVVKRSESYFFYPEKDYEQSGQVNNVVFLEGLVCFKGKWFLYYGTADSSIAVATREDKYCQPTSTGSGTPASIFYMHNAVVSCVLAIFTSFL